MASHSYELDDDYEVAFQSDLKSFNISDSELSVQIITGFLHNIVEKTKTDLKAARMEAFEAADDKSTKADIIASLNKK